MRIHGIVYREDDDSFCWAPVCAVCQKTGRMNQVKRGLEFGGMAFVCDACIATATLPSLAVPDVEPGQGKETP